MDDHAENVSQTWNQEHAEVTAKEGLTIEEFFNNNFKKKKREAKEWHRQDAVMKGLNKPKADKKKLVIVEESVDAKPIVKSHSSIVEFETAAVEMVGTAEIPKPNDYTLMAEKASKPEDMKEDMAVNVPMPKPQLKRRRLKKMSLKKKVEKSSKLIEPEKAITEGENKDDNSSDDSLELTKIIDTMVQDIINAPGNSPHRHSIVIQLAFK